ncbi:MAG: GcrA family cell cycle regulator [Pseudomonadota bacterium]
MSWTEERVTLLTQLWGNGKSASEIAEIIGDVTRNAVIGKAHRLGLSGRPSPIKKVAPSRMPAVKLERRPATPKRREAKAAKPETAPQRPANVVLHPKAKIDDAPVGGATILDLTERMCRWPIGDPKDPEFRFCGRTREGCLPYCAEHAAKAYQPPKPRREEERAKRSA